MPKSRSIWTYTPSACITYTGADDIAYQVDVEHIRLSSGRHFPMPSNRPRTGHVRMVNRRLLPSRLQAAPVEDVLAGIYRKPGALSTARDIALVAFAILTMGSLVGVVLAAVALLAIHLFPLGDVNVTMPPDMLRFFVFGSFTGIVGLGVTNFGDDPFECEEATLSLGAKTAVVAAVEARDRILDSDVWQSGRLDVGALGWHPDEVVGQVVEQAVKYDRLKNVQQSLATKGASGEAILDVLVDAKRKVGVLEDVARQADAASVALLAVSDRERVADLELEARAAVTGAPDVSKASAAFEALSYGIRRAS